MDGLQWLGSDRMGEGSSPGVKVKPRKRGDRQVVVLWCRLSAKQPVCGGSEMWVENGRFSSKKLALTWAITCVRCYEQSRHFPEQGPVRAPIGGMGWTSRLSTCGFHGFSDFGDRCSLPGDAWHSERGRHVPRRCWKWFSGRPGKWEDLAPGVSVGIPATNSTALSKSLRG